MWDNVVTACKPCNHRKGGKSLAEARMPLRKEPGEPRAGLYYTIERRLDLAVQDDWHKFLPGFVPTTELRGSGGGSHLHDSSSRSVSSAVGVVPISAD